MDTRAALQKYEFLHELGSGHTAQVRLAKIVATGESVAIKVIKKPKEECKLKAMLEVEKDILRRIKHPNLVSVVEIIETADVLYIVMELVEGGDLFDMIVKHEFFSEVDAQRITKELLDALHYLHSTAHVAHRDLKPENILLTRQDLSSTVKITDFGMSKIYLGNESTNTMDTRCGTPGYCSPEIVTKKKYSSKVDMWSIGVVLYIMLCGRPPFYGQTDLAVMRKIKQGSFSMNGKRWQSISQPAKDFVASLLQVDPTRRPTALQALSHPWFTGGPAAATATVEPVVAPPVMSTGLLTARQRELLDGSCREPTTAKLQPQPRADAPVKVSKQVSTVLSRHKCSLNKQPGQAVVTNRHIRFVDEETGVPIQKPLKIKDVLDFSSQHKHDASLFELDFSSMYEYASSGGRKTLQVVTRNKTVHEFAGLQVQHHDALKTSILRSMQMNAASEARQLQAVAAH